jgi:choline dehydrogenase-like flavoprotein
VIIDANSLPDGKLVTSDLCIIGAGIAGLPVAYAFLDTGVSVTIVESGGLEPNATMQSLNTGKNIGVPYYDLDQTRARAFGGTSHMWTCELGNAKLGVRLMGLDEMDFEKRDWVPNSGWPFTKNELDPYYIKAHEFCEIGPYSYSVNDWRDALPAEDIPLLPDENTVTTRIFQFAGKELWYKKYKDVFEKARNISTYINATVLNIAAAESGNVIDHLEAGTPEGKRFRFKPKWYILAAGAIEAPRILLLSDSVHHNGLGNLYDNVGRYFMEHPHIWTGYIVPSSDKILNRIGLYKVHTVRNTTIMGKLALNHEIQRKEKLLNFVTSIHPMNKSFIPEGMLKFKKLIGAFIRGRISPENVVQAIHNLPDVGTQITRKVRRKIDRKYNYKLNQPNVLVMNPMAEQIPNPDSRVTLNNDRDMFGQNRVNLKWQLTSQDINSIRRSQQIMKSELKKHGIGDLVIELTDDSIPRRIHGGWHNMGTTRMHVDPKSGVVDQNCKVHGLSNLYIAGPSVFPTVGCANPVLTSIAMSFRLADYLRKNRGTL